MKSLKVKVTYFIDLLIDLLSTGTLALNEFVTRLCTNQRIFM